MIKKIAVTVIVIVSLMALTVHAKDGNITQKDEFEMPVIHSQF